MKRFMILVVAFYCFLTTGLAPSNASASIIASFSGTFSEDQKDVFNAAVSAWSSLLQISQDLTISFSLGTFSSSSTLGSTQITGASSGLPTASSIQISTSSLISWNLNSAASGYYDALSIIEHEIGHALGIAYISSLLYYSEVEEGTDGYYIDGYKIYYKNGMNMNYKTNLMSHLADSSDLMYPYTSSGTRNSISSADLDILSSVYGYTAVPLPASLLFFGPGLAGLFAIRRRLAA